MTITEFCNRHCACAEGFTWALAQGVETMAELWELQMRANWRIWIATRPGLLTPQERVAWACRCVRRIWHLLPDERSRTAVEVAERWARGDASEEELVTAARAAAYASATSAFASASSFAFAAAAAHAAAEASDSAYAAHAAAYATRSANAERDWQAQELVRLCGNPFKKEDKT